MSYSKVSMSVLLLVIVQLLTSGAWAQQSPPAGPPYTRRAPVKVKPVAEQAPPKAELSPEGRLWSMPANAMPSPESGIELGPQEMADITKFDTLDEHAAILVPRGNQTKEEAWGDLVAMCVLNPMIWTLGTNSRGIITHNFPDRDRDEVLDRIALLNKAERFTINNVLVKKLYSRGEKTMRNITGHGTWELNESRNAERSKTVDFTKSDMVLSLAFVHLRPGLTGKKDEKKEDRFLMVQTYLRRGPDTNEKWTVMAMTVMIPEGLDWLRLSFLDLPIAGR